MPRNDTNTGIAGVGSQTSVKGTEQMKVPQVDPNAYQNPTGNQAPAWQQGMKNMLGATTGPASQMGYTSAGKAAQIGPVSTYGGAKMDQGQYGQSWNAQWGLANQLGAMAAGQGPSMAQVQAQQSQQANLANQMAMLGGQRGAGNAALAGYQAQQLGAQGMQQAAQQAVAGRTQEEMAALQAQGQLYGNLNQQAQQFAGNQAQLQQQAMLASMGAINAQNQQQAQLNQNQAQYQAGLYQQANQSNLSAQQAQTALNAQQYDNYMSMLQQMNMAQWQANMAQQQQQSSNYLTAAGIQQGLSINQANMDANIAGSVAGGAAGVIGAIPSIVQAASDIKSKENITSGKKQLGEVLDQVYNSPGALKLLMLL